MITYWKPLNQLFITEECIFLVFTYIPHGFFSVEVVNVKEPE